MISPSIILGFKLEIITVVISVFVVGVLLQIISRKMKKDSNFQQEDNWKSSGSLTEPIK